ncbi:hypothetical protein [Paraburkholderia aspalathi]|uniref:hypothetical protein n=1 Tax=Paraburkholderia aspalathi TaxID=1324617 RepID=UPI001BA6A1A4|nr:hypothetical protein [Paraburkholderia aspalathi]
MTPTLDIREWSRKQVKELGEHALWAFMQVLYTTVPLLVLFGVTAVLGGGDLMTVFGGSEAMFVVVIAFIDGARDSLRGVSLDSQKGETEKLDTVAIGSTILVVMSVLTLALSIAMDKNAIAISPGRHEAFEILVRNLLLLALVTSWICKFRLKRLEQKLSKARLAASSSPHFQD